MKDVIMITAKLYNCRDTCKRFLRNEFYERIQPYQTVIKKVMEANKVNELQALMTISETKAYNENGMGQMLFISAAVELMEPSK
jgi:hypothetical protein